MIIVIALFAAFYKPRKPVLPPDAVAFDGAGILLKPGPDWERIREGEYTRERNLALPVLSGLGQFQGSMIEVLTSPNFPKDPAEMAANLFPALQREPSVIKESIKQEPFVAPSGLRGVHIQCRIMIQDRDRKGESKAHCFLVGDGKTPCARINYTVAPDRDSTAVQQMIQDTVAPWP